MTPMAGATSWWRELPWLAAAAMTPAVLLLQHLDPCDSAAAISMGNSMVHIGLTLTLGMLTCLGFALQQGGVASSDSTVRKRRMKRVLAIVCCLAIAWLAISTIAVAGRGNVRYAVNGFWQWTSMLVWSASACMMATRPGFGRLAIIAALALGVAISKIKSSWDESLGWDQANRSAKAITAPTVSKKGIPPAWAVSRRKLCGSAGDSAAVGNFTCK